MFISNNESNMQIALTARYNSGCISQQVGACVTGKEGYILGVGWNDVQENSIPCVYRSASSLVLENNKDPEFSSYELSEDFKSYVRKNLGASTDPFCFKDLENAFLQSAKVGGVSLKNGTLYSTASPCQLCAKKAMQLGIRRIVYIVLILIFLQIKLLSQER